MKHFFICLLLLAISGMSQGQTVWYDATAGSQGNDCSHFGYQAGQLSNNNNSFTNSYFGHQAGRRHAIGFDNTYFGSLVSSWATDGGYQNTFIGSFSASSTGTNFANGQRNTFFGAGAGINSRRSSQNTYLGMEAGILDNSAFSIEYNTIAGNQSNILGGSNTNRVKNTWIGYQAGYNNNGSGNVFLGFQAGYNSTGSNQLYIDNSNTTNPLIYGNFTNNALGINTRQLSDAGTNYTLSINGKMRANEVKVYTGWADYVFEPGYRLRSLRQVKRYIQQHRHLPDVPSAKEVKQQGIFVGETQATLLRKIEELTLYMLAAHQNTQQLQSEAKQLVASVAQLKKRLAQLHQTNATLQTKLPK